MGWRIQRSVGVRKQKDGPQRLKKKKTTTQSSFIYKSLNSKNNVCSQNTVLYLIIISSTIEFILILSFILTENKISDEVSDSVIGIKFKCRATFNVIALLAYTFSTCHCVVMNSQKLWIATCAEERMVSADGEFKGKSKKADSWFTGCSGDKL